jgi:hypothetical protein
MIVCGALTFAGFAGAARWLGCNHFLAALGGFLWAFALVHVEHGKHQQMLLRCWMPLAAYHAWHLARTPNLRSLNRTLAFSFLQAATCIYSGWFLVVGLAAFVPAAAATRPEGLRGLYRFALDDRWRVGRVFGLWGLAFAAFFTPYVIANFGISRSYGESLDMIPPLAGWLTGPPGSRWHETLRPHLRPVGEECILFSGFGLYVLFVAAAVHVWVTRRHPDRPPGLALVAACGVTVAVWWLLTLNVSHGVSAWWLVRFIPGGMAIRAVTRVYTIIYLFTTLGVVMWLQLVTARIGRPWLRGAVLLTAAGPVVFEQTGYEQTNMARSEFYPQVDRCAEGLRGADAGYVLPKGGPYQLYGDVVGMWAGLRANVPVANGYSGRYPVPYPLLAPPDTDAALREWLTGRFRGRVAIVDPDHPEQVRYIQIE